MSSKVKGTGVVNGSYQGVRDRYALTVSAAVPSNCSGSTYSSCFNRVCDRSFAETSSTALLYVPMNCSKIPPGWTTGAANTDARLPTKPGTSFIMSHAGTVRKCSGSSVSPWNSSQVCSAGGGSASVNRMSAWMQVSLSLILMPAN